MLKPTSPTTNPQTDETSYLNISTEDFLNWLPYNVGVRIEFLKGCNFKPEILEGLKELFWDNFLRDAKDEFYRDRFDQEA